MKWKALLEKNYTISSTVEIKAFAAITMEFGNGMWNHNDRGLEDHKIKTSLRFLITNNSRII